MDKNLLPPAAALLESLRDAAGIRAFVETGTGAGDVAFMAGDIFDTVITMESDPAVYATAHARLSGRKGLLPLDGDSRELLPRLMPRLAKPAVFWLDARPVDGTPPLAAELAVLAAEPMAHVVVVPLPAALAPEAIVRTLSHPHPRDAAVCGGLLLAVPRILNFAWEALFPQGHPPFVDPAVA